MIRSLSLMLVGALALLPYAPSSALAQDSAARPGSDLIVEVLDPHHPANLGTLAEDRLPIRFEGLQPESLDQLRAWLLLRADPKKFPDESKPLFGNARHPSRRRLLIRIDPGQVFGWAQAIMQCCTMIPGREMKKELQNSPLIYKITLQMGKTGRRFETPLPVDQGLSGRGRRLEEAEVILKLPRSSWDLPAHEREVIFLREGSNEPFGRSKGIAYHSSTPGHYSLLLDGPDTLLKVRRYLVDVRVRDLEAGARLNVYPRVPAAYAFEVLEAMTAARYQSIAYSGIPNYLFKELEAGKMNPPNGMAKLLDGIGGKVPKRTVARRGFPGEEIEEEVEQPRKLRQRGGGLAVDQGLAWLARHQRQDGSWPSRDFPGMCDPALGDGKCDGNGHPAYDVGTTGLSLLAFLGAGNTHRAGPYKQVVRDGLKWLKAQQDAEGCFGSRRSPHYTYNHAIATLAMCEAYGMTRSGIWKATAQNGANYVMKAQNPYKAWRYGERPGDNDTSVTTWMIMALKSAKMAGLQVNDTSFQWAQSFIDEMTDDETGRTGYTRRGERPVRAEGRLEAFPAEHSESLTAMGIVVRLFCGEDVRNSKVIGMGAELISKKLPVWDAKNGRIDMVYWYFGTLANFQLGGRHWKRWNQAMRSAILKSQRTDGCAAGSWDPAGAWGNEGGRVFSTALMTLCTEVYYRYGRVMGTRK